MKEKLSPRMDYTAQPKPATALCGVVSADGKIAYPPGVKEITDKITTDEMIKRLKVGVSAGASASVTHAWLLASPSKVSEVWWCLLPCHPLVLFRLGL